MMTARGRAVPALLVLPAALLCGLVVIGGLVVLVTQAVGLLPVVGRPGLTLEPFTSAGPELAGSVVSSLTIAGAATALALVVGFAGAVLVLRALRGSRVVAWVSTITVPIPHLVGAATVGLLLADGGVLPRLFGIGGSAWPDLVGGRAQIATILEFAWKESAFVALVLVATLATRLPGYEETATMLGAGPFARLRLVVLPLAAPALTLTGGIVFVYTMGSYEVPWLLGAAYPEPLPVLAVRLYDGVSLTSRPAAAAVSVITVLLSGGVVAASLGVLRARRSWR